MYISAHQLTQIELIRRHSGAYRPAFDIINRDSAIPSFLREKYHLFFDDLIELLNIDMTLLDYNYTRLNQYMRTLVYEQRKMFHLRPCEIQRIDEKEYPLALEFYLQFDSMHTNSFDSIISMVSSILVFLVNMFYMKTCSFRYARPHTLNEVLFCLQEPEARYKLAACDNCGLCYPKYDRMYRSRKSIVEFSQAHRHIFVNGYQSILNCSAVSLTNQFCLHYHTRTNRRDLFYSSFVSFVVMSYTKHHLCLNMFMWKR